MTDFSEIYSAAPDAAIKAKLDEHIRQILAKPSISRGDYDVLREKLSQIDSSGGFNSSIWPLFMLLQILYGGKK